MKIYRHYKNSQGDIFSPDSKEFSSVFPDFFDAPMVAFFCERSPVKTVNDLLRKEHQA